MRVKRDAPCVNVWGACLALKVVENRWYFVYVKQNTIGQRAEISHNYNGTHVHLKPIFHCDAKPFALGPDVGLDPQRQNFASEIPTCWYLKTLRFALPPTLKFALPTKPTPNTSRWNIGSIGSAKFSAKFSCWPCRFHVVCVNFISVG